MDNITRRSFLKGAAAASITGLGFPSIGRAATTYGALPVGLNLPKYRILDILMPGGASQWESFWVSHDIPGGGSQPNWRGLGDFVSDLNWIDLPEAPNGPETNAFLTHANGAPMLSWGPATKPLWRSDILNRTRMVLTKHELEVHSLGIFLNLTGREFGRPRAACLGAPIQRHFQSLPDPMGIPYSYVFAPSHLGKPYVQSHATAIGQHPGASRPLALKVGESIDDLLTRNQVPPGADAVTALLRDQYQNLLRFQGDGNPLRSAGSAAYEGASQYLANAAELHPFLGGDELVADTVIPPVADSTVEFFGVPNPTKRSLELAATIFDQGARHITVVDGGLNQGGLRDSGFPYDGHRRDSKNVVEMTSAHLFNLSNSLEQVIAQPGESSAGKIDLDNTIVRIFSEFGRDPSPNTAVVDNYPSCGREHFPYANFQILIGGPVTHRGLQGWVGFEGNNPNSAVAHEALSATDVWAAMLMAGGVDPFASENLTTGDDFSNVITATATKESEIRSSLLEKVFGYSSWI